MMDRHRSHRTRRSATNIYPNICMANCIKSIKCDHPCSEGHEVENLLSKNLSQRNKGFLVERFIKPPVTLTYEFTCEINLRYILVLCSVGAQKSSGIELSIQTSEKQFEIVGSGVLKGQEKGFVFYCYSEDVKAKFGEGLFFCPFKSVRNISKVVGMKIKIFKTQDSSVPALGKVDIWGVPNKVSPSIENMSVKTQDLSHSDKSSETKLRRVSSEGSQSLPVECDLFKNLNVPEDFIDPITCDIMCQPVTLPSGKIIDVSTLEAHKKAESRWGRGPSDPFTGVLFTSSSKPIAASDLKARIDKFVCDNSNHPQFKNIPRTVGRSYWTSQNSVLKPTVSKLISNEENNLPGRSETNYLCRPINVSNCEIPVKRRKVEENKTHDCNVKPSSSKKELLAQPKDVQTFSVASNNASVGISFQERMEKSLELSLKSTLSSLPSFTSDYDTKSNEKSRVECHVCKLCDNLFSIPCCHFICRNCLISFKAKGLFSCTVCKTSFKSHDVQKIHISK